MMLFKVHEHDNYVKNAILRKTSVRINYNTELGVHAHNQC